MKSKKLNVEYLLSASGDDVTIIMKENGANIANIQYVSKKPVRVRSTRSDPLQLKEIFEEFARNDPQHNSPIAQATLCMSSLNEALTMEAHEIRKSYKRIKNLLAHSKIIERLIADYQ